MARKGARFCRRPCLFFLFCVVSWVWGWPGNHRHRTYDMERKDPMYACRSDHADWYATLGRSFPPYTRRARAGSLQAIWFRENVLGGTKWITQLVLYRENVLYGTKQLCREGDQRSARPIPATFRRWIQNTYVKSAHSMDKCHCLAIIRSTTKYFHPTANVNVNANVNANLWRTSILRTNMPLADTTFPWEPGKLTSLEYVKNPEHA